jgi:hypothetical protein
MINISARSFSHKKSTCYQDDKGQHKHGQHTNRDSECCRFYVLVQRHDLDVSIGFCRKHFSFRN